MIKLQWKDINYSVISKDSYKSKPFAPVYIKKDILLNGNGCAVSGELLAIMGPTGCGKSSLLNVLAARVGSGGSSSAKLSGSIYINGRLRNDDALQRMSAYVEQDDRLYPHITVYETLTLASNFYLPYDTSDEKKQNLVNKIINELGLSKVRDTIIGDEKVRGVSGGERKRTVIATHMISEPAIFFLDEPTSSLDSFQAQSVVDCIKSMTLSNKIVITVIHQPRSSIFEMFDELVLLSCGRTVYLGPAKDANQYFKSMGFMCPQLFNPSDFFLDVLSPDSRSAENEIAADQRIKQLGDAWDAKTAAEYEVVVENDDVQQSYMTLTTQISSIVNIYKLCRNFKLLAWRAYIEQTRDVFIVIVKICVTLFFALLLGGLYNNIGYSQKGANNRVGFLFLTSINQGFNGVLGVVNTFPREKVIVNRERSARAYDTLSYFIAKYFVEMPLNTLPALIYAIVVYWMVGLNPDRFGYFILIVMMEAVVGVSLGLAVSAIAPNTEIALALGPPTIIIALLFGGFYINVDSLPIVANWVPYTSFLKWTFQALAINEFRGETFTCEGGPMGSCLKTGEQVLARLSFADETIHEACFGLGMVLLGFTISAIYFLDRSKATYIKLGFIGGKHLYFDRKIAVATAIVDDKENINN